MKLEALISEWKKDTIIDDTELATESAKIPNLHAKYYEYYIKENLILSSVESEYNQLYKLRLEYYTGRLSEEECAENDLPQFDLKLMRNDVDSYIMADKAIINALLRVSMVKQKVEFLKDIIKSLHSRGWLIKNMIEVIKFETGC